MQPNALRFCLIPVLAAASLCAQTPTPPKVTVVMATLTLKDSVTRDQLKKVMPTEVRQTVDLYLDGKIREWYARGDGKGVVFIVDCKTVDEAKAILEQLPLVKANYASFD
jgi:muconolactone delta-isomerase